MSELSQRLNRFRTRVRFVRAWRGLALGICVGAVLATLWAAFDLAGWFYSEWLWLGILVAVAGLAGAIAGFALKVSDAALAESIDRRAMLQDRLASAAEQNGRTSLFGADLSNDAGSHLGSVRPKTVFPFRVGRWQAGALASTALAAAIFMLGNTPILMNDEQKKQLAELKAEGAKVERVLRENLENPESQSRLSEQDKKMAEDLMRLKRDVDKGRLSKEEALRRANEIAKQAEQLMQDHFKNSAESLKNADAALDPMRRQAMAESGLRPENAAMMKMSEQARDAAMANLQQQIDALQAQINSIQSQMNQLDQQLSKPGLTDAERKKLEEQRKALEDALKAAEGKKQTASDALQQLKLSKEARDTFNRLMDRPLYKKLQELAEKLAKNADQSARTGQQKLSKEELERLQKELEALAKELKDDKAMDAYLQKLIDALKEAKNGGDCQGVCGLHGRLPIPGRGSPSEDQYAGDSGMINKLDKGVASKGTTHSTVITGAQRETAGQDPYIEIKAPTELGNRSSIPYVKVLPSYKKKAEAALDRQQIPKEHQKRVKEYFESLNGK
jgi:hypothetical protein